MNQLLAYWHSYGLNAKYGVTLVALVVLALVINTLLRALFNWMIKAAEHTKTPWDEIFVKAMSPPVRTLVWALGIFLALYLLLQLVHQQKHDAMVYLAVKVCVLAAVIWFMLRFVRLACDYFLKKYTQTSDKSNLLVDPSSIRAIKQFSSIIILVIAVLLLLGLLEIPLSGLLTFGGVSGAVIAFSAKDMMSNFFGGMLIYFDRPFSVGDWIVSPDRELEGTVEKIGWRLTRIRSFDKRPIYVPNAIFTSAIIVNPSRMNNRRIKQNIGVRYEDAKKLPAILADIRSMLKNHPEIDQKPTTLVNMINGTTFSSSAIIFNIYTFTKTTDWAKFQCVQDEIMLLVEDLIAKHEAEIAFPTRTVKVEGPPL